jgi:N-ethylmaleimide reductase
MMKRSYSYKRTDLYGGSIENRADDIHTGIADVAPIGAWALANPDFIERLKTGALLNEPDPSTYSGGDSKGYTDYPIRGNKNG